MCETYLPFETWDPAVAFAAGELLGEWVQEGKRITSLDFKLELRKRVSAPVYQHEVSNFLRRQFGEGALTGSHRSEHTAPNGTVYFSYDPRIERKKEHVSTEEESSVLVSAGGPEEELEPKRTLFRRLCRWIFG